jgi:hypothetical protein
VIANPRRRPVQREASEQEQGITLLRSLGGAVYRLGVRRRKGDHPSTMMSAGLPDVLAFLPHRGSGVRTFVAWECKAPGGRVRPEQREFAGLCFEAGVAHVTGDLTALMRWLVDAKFLRADQLPASRQPDIRSPHA